MNRSDLRTLVADWLDDPNLGYFSQTVINTRLNLAARRVQQLIKNTHEDHYKKCVESSTVADQRNYKLPTDFLELRYLGVVTSGSGETATVQQLLPLESSERKLLCLKTGTPTHYDYEKSHLLLWPLPDSAKTLRLEYIYRIADMDDDSDEPDIPEEHHELVAVIAALDGFIKDDRVSAQLERKREEYEQWLAIDDEERSLDGPRQIVQTRY